MKTKNILIPGTLTTRTCLRVFLADFEAEVRGQTFALDEYFDRPFRFNENRPPTHEEIVARIRRLYVAKRKSGPLDQFGTVLRSNTLYSGVIYAYQLVVTSTVMDNRSKFGRGHENYETTGTMRTVSKKVFLFGRRKTEAKVKQLASWVRSQMKLHPGEREEEVFKVKGVSAYTALGARKVARKSKLPILKLGHATFVRFDPKKMEFRPLE